MGGNKDVLLDLMATRDPPDPDFVNSLMGSIDGMDAALICTAVGGGGSGGSGGGAAAAFARGGAAEAAEALEGAAYVRALKPLRFDAVDLVDQIMACTGKGGVTHSFVKSGSAGGGGGGGGYGHQKVLTICCVRTIRFFIRLIQRWKVKVEGIRDGTASEKRKDGDCVFTSHSLSSFLLPLNSQRCSL
jgi:hypothetical protein